MHKIIFLSHQEDAVFAILRNSWSVKTWQSGINYAVPFDLKVNIQFLEASHFEHDLDM